MEEKPKFNCDMCGREIPPYMEDEIDENNLEEQVCPFCQTKGYISEIENEEEVEDESISTE